MEHLAQILAVTPLDVSPLPHTAANSAHLKLILTLVFTIIGALSVLFVTIGGFRYVAAQGNPQAAERAKGTILYAIIGLLISITAVAIVTFVMGKV